MSVAKASVLNMINFIPDDIQDEMEVIESLYKLVKLERSKASVVEKGTLSTDEVRSRFANKNRRKESITA